VVIIPLPLSFLVLCIRIKLNLIKILFGGMVMPFSSLSYMANCVKISDKTKWIYKYPFHSDIVMEWHR
jgi:hypothetical protein